MKFTHKQVKEAIRLRRFYDQRINDLWDEMLHKFEIESNLTEDEVIELFNEVY